MVDTLLGLVSAMERTEDLGELQVLALDFWDALVEASDNVAYRLAFNTLRQTYELIRGALVIVMADEVSDRRGHLEVLQAVAAADPEAAHRAAAALVQRGTAKVFDLLDALAAERETTPTSTEGASS